MKKFNILVLSVALVFTLALTGCTKGNSTSSATPDQTSSTTVAPSGTAATPTPTATLAEGGPNAAGYKVITNKDPMPIVKDKITLKVLVRGNPDVPDMNTNDFTKYLEEKTNIHIEWSVADPDNAQQKLNLVMAGGDLPDIIMNMQVTPTQEMIYASQGLIIPLQGLIDKYAPNLQQILKDNPDTKQAITAPGNNIYSLPRINDCLHCAMDRKMFVYQPWLTKLNLQMPTTTDDFEKMLLAFKNGDPNGNNKKDEIPLAGAINSMQSAIDVFLMNAFIYDDSDKRLLLDNGKIDVAYNKPAWKDGLTYLHKLYSEGLITPESFTAKKADVKKMAENADVPILGAAPAHSLTTITTIGTKSTRWLEYQPIKPLKGPSGVQASVFLPYGNVDAGRFLITKANKNVEASMRWADALYSTALSLSETYGLQGRDWDWATTDLKGRDGQPALYKVINPQPSVNTHSWDALSPAYTSDGEYYRGQAIITQPNMEKKYYDSTKENYDPYKPSMDRIIPPLYFTKEESVDISNLEPAITSYFTTMTAKFINGDADINKDWDAYLKTLNDMGLKKYISVYQQAYDEHMGKK